MPPAPLFHATSYAAVGRIAAEGLRPTAGGATFRWGSYAGHSAGKVFLAADPFAARAWFSKVEQALEHNAGDADPDDLEAHAEVIVPVLLRIDGRWRAAAKVDPVGDRDIPGSLYVERAIPPQDIAWWTGRTWAPLSSWGGRPATAATKRVCEAGTCWLELRDRAVFHPGEDDSRYGVAWREAKLPAKPRVLRVVWRGNAEATVRELLAATQPAGFSERLFTSWMPVPALHWKTGMPDPQFWGVKARQAGFKDGVEIVGLPGGELGVFRDRLSR